MRATTAAMTLAGAAWAAAMPVARAGQCGKPDLIDMVPSDGATGVPVNATLGAHYAASAEWVDEAVVVERLPDGPPQSMKPTWDPTEQLLSVTPAAPLEAGVDYVIHWPALRGLNAAAPGLGGMATFTAGTAADVAAPAFAGVVGLQWDLDRASDDCVDGLVERFVFDIELAPASDDGGTSGLTLMLFQTMGPQVMGMPTPLPARAWPQDSTAATQDPAQPVHTQVKLAKDVSVGEICFGAIVRDTVGHFSASNNAAACVQTTAPPFFNGCSVAASNGGASGRPAALAALALLALAARRRRRGSRAPR